MKKRSGVFAVFLGLVALCATAVPAVADAPIPVGYISWDVNFPGNAGQFDITNLTGPNSLPPDFPITTLLNLTSLSLTVDFVGGGSTVYGSSYFSLSPDGESFDGTAIPIGGTNPQPLDATLTGSFSPLVVTSGGGPVSLGPDFSVSFSDTPNLVDGDLGVIYATPCPAGAACSVTPEPGYWAFLAIGLVSLLLVKSRKLAAGLKTAAFKSGFSAAGKVLLPVLALALVLASSAFSQVKLPAVTSPSSGVAGVTNVNVSGAPFPAGNITPANVVVTFASTCGGSPVTTTGATSVKKVLGATDRVNFNIPAGLITGAYFVTIADSAAGDADFTTLAGSCSEVQVTGSAPILNACLAGSSMGVLLPSGGKTGNVTAYVPKGYWSGGTTGVYVQNIEGTIGSTSLVATPSIANSCSSNPATGQTVCVGNNTDVYLLTGTTLNTTLTSSSNTRAGFSGGSCNNCGVALNGNNNTAAINMGLTGGSTNSGIQILNLNTNTFQTPLAMNAIVSENISVDPTRSLVLTAGEGGNFTLAQIQSNGSLKEFDSTFNTGFENDSSAEDCSTGIGIAPGEFTNSVALVNLNAISFGTTTYTAPNAIATLSTAYGFSAGLSGSAVAQGSGHLAVVTGEFGGNTFAVLKLPATAGTGTPALVDYAVAQIPGNAACGGTFEAGYDPHTITAYTSPNTGDSYAVFAGYSGGVPACLAVVDMTTVINSTLSVRGGGGYLAHDVSPANLPAGAVTFFAL